MKKRNIIIYLLALLVIAGGVYFSSNILTYLNGDLKEEYFPNEGVEEIITQETIEEKEVAFIELIESQEKRVNVSNKPKEELLTPERCNQISADKVAEKQLCFNYVNLSIIVENGEFFKCESLDSSLQDVCLYKVTEKKKDSFDSCFGIGDESIKNLCLKNAAIFSRDATYCDKILDTYKKDECNDSLLSSRMKLNDISQCTSIEIPIYFEICVNNANQDCEELKDEETINKCKSWRYFDDIIKNKDKSFCKILPVEKFKKVCDSYFIKEIYIDFDSDGVNDKEELNYGTDPFVFDEGLKEEIKNRKNNANIINQTLDEARKVIDLAIANIE